jgi:predicted CoA-binding protein
MKKTTLILGATTNPSRYAYRAAAMLTAQGHPIFPVGIKRGEIFGKTIESNPQPMQGIDTITLYLNPNNQKGYYDFILQTQPKRIIFNPGTENPELEQLAEAQGIETLEACTLVMISMGVY